MILDRCSNDLWGKHHQLTPQGKNRWTIKLTEPLGWNWSREIVSYELPPGARKLDLRVMRERIEVPSQRNPGGSEIAFLIEKLTPEETLEFTIEKGSSQFARDCDVRIEKEADGWIADTGKIAVKLPLSMKVGEGQLVPGPIQAIRRSGSTWFGRGRIDSPRRVREIVTKIIECGPLWKTIEVTYKFEPRIAYVVRVTLRPGEEYVEVSEDSTVPVNLWPALRPYREIGSLGGAFWSQSPDVIGKPCTRPCPTTNFIFEFTPEFEPDRMITHETAAVQMMDLPLRWGPVRTYTAMRPCYVGVDAAWMGVYHCDRDDLFGIASTDIAHWRLPDDYIHPAHRIAGANSEVLLIDSKEVGSHFRFPIEQMSRRWFFAGFSRENSAGLGVSVKPEGQPVRLEAAPTMPLWALRTRRGDLRLNKVKEWITNWPDANDVHPRVYCGPDDFPAIRERMKRVPELRQNFEATKQWRPADRYIATGVPEAGAFERVEAQTSASELVATVLERGFASLPYAIGLSRPMRRYISGVDVLWSTLSPSERKTARRTIAIAAYLMTDGDWWSFPFRKDESTYLPNFNSDVFTCAGTAGLFLSDHPCSKMWVKHLVKRMDIELEHHLRIDGGGSENVGTYLVSTWSQLLLPALWALRRNKVKDYSKDKYVLAGARFLVKVISSPDPRANWERMMPPIGHHPQAKTQLAMMAWFASFLKKSDRTLAGNLMWAWREMGAPVRNFYDHQGPPANPLTRHYIFHDPSIKPIEPKLPLHSSMVLPNVGTIFRTHGLTRKGSYVFLKAGREHSHHDDDEGSFHYFGRGIPLALDGLRLENGAPAAEHNTISFDKPGQPTGNVVCFRSTPTADYVRAVMPPRGFCSDSNFPEGAHRSGWERQLLLVKSSKPGGVEYLVVKDVVTGPDAGQWNLDVLSRRPEVRSPSHIWFPGHEEFEMGMDLFLLEPFGATANIEKGHVNESVVDPVKRAELQSHFSNYAVNEHWITHVHQPPGATFVALLFPRKSSEKEPSVEYLAREETLRITHGEGKDLIFLRPCEQVDTIIEDIDFRGRAGVVCERKGKRVIQPLDAVEMNVITKPNYNLVQL